MSMPPIRPVHEAGDASFRGRRLSVGRGHPLPLGTSRAADGINFVVISRHATAVRLVLSDPRAGGIVAEIPLDPRRHRTGNHWHIRIDGLTPNEFAYGYRVDGPSTARHRFDPSRVLIDPASRALSGGQSWGVPARQPRQSLPVASATNWLENPGPQIPWEDTILYELHVRGYTASPSSGVAHPGTFAGLIEWIPHIQALGVTAVELLPVDEFDELACPFINPYTGERLRNFWGYSSLAYAAPKAAYASNPEGTAPWDEFWLMVKAFHGAGLEVILDVVFNHTAEGGADGPTYNFRGLDNSLYYLVDDEGSYLNFSGCGNTINSNHPIVRGFLLNCLYNWVAEAGVDGFRFDLASVLGRDRRGHVLREPPIVERISEDALLANTKLIAEPWDAAGLYQVGSFPGGTRWAEWNGRYRDDIRRFWRGEPGMTSALATRLCGSDDLYGVRGPLHSINFITCHDGFTLADLVAYDRKHNEANGEGNRDGLDANWSWNCGVEGPTADPAVLALRRRQARNLIATLLVSQGVPMLLAGDEFLRTQHGNNNAWCQDNPTGWVDWTLAEANADFLRFVRRLIALRRRHPVLRRRTFLTGRSDTGPPDVVWHGREPCCPDFSFASRALALALDGRRGDRPGVIDRDLYIALNAHWEPAVFRIPASPSGRPWLRAVDTALLPPDDALEPDQGPVVPLLHPYRIEARSLIILVSGP
jgi:glycogen operon protein